MKTITSYPKHTKNPFMEEILCIKTKNKTVKVSKNPIDVYDEDTGQLHQADFISVQERVDKEQFVKLLGAGVQLMVDLSPKALKVFIYCLKSLQQNSDQIYFDIDECKKMSGYRNHRSVYDGLVELIEKKVMAKANRVNIYFINPQYAFNGNRLVLIRDYIKDEGTNGITLPVNNEDIHSLNP
jgi:hypothetical protein